MVSPQTITEVQTLTVPTPGEELILHLAATREAISSLLMAKRDHIQKPIYFVSKALQGPEVNYPTLEKLALTLVHIARRLRRYFQAHTIYVLTDQPIRLGQILADFVAESTIKGVQDITGSIPQWPADLTSHTWTLYTDGVSSNDGSGAGLILTDPRRNEVTYALRFDFPTSNNEAEYEALIAGLELATRLEVSHLKVFSDSLLITNHVKGTYEAREDSIWVILFEGHVDSARYKDSTSLGFILTSASCCYILVFFIVNHYLEPKN
ncbi:reverse transcriptase domain-containing protein [Tanacetum coccineum]